MTDSRQGAAFPSWFPGWARELGRIYYGGNTSMFLLHGNVDDLIRVEAAAGVEYQVVSEFLASQLFGAWDVVLHYDLSRPPRPLAGANKERLQRMRRHVERQIGNNAAMPRDPTKVLALLSAYLELMLVGKPEEQRPSVALLFDYAHLMLPRTATAHVSESQAANLVTVVNWARNPYVKRVNFAFCLISEKLSDLSEALTRSPHTARLELPYPDRAARLAFIEYLRAGRDFAKICEVSPEALAELTAGITLVGIQGLLMNAIRNEQLVSMSALKEFKKTQIEGTCQGMVEFVEPSYTLDDVVGHVAAKKRLAEDAQLIRENHLKAAPMGYLLCGAVGTGKTYLAECYAGTVGIPCLKLLNFRSKYVGETEGNLEKILKVLRVMGPVVVIIDEADAALGDRGQEGDSGTSNRVFAQIASQMGNTAYRGKIIWFLMTCRPDNLPIDLKRQGRAEVHMPLFHPQTPDEVRQMFAAMGKKIGVRIAEADAPAAGALGLSGADIEGIVGRARRLALLAGGDEITAQHLTTALEGFIPSAENAEKQLQELAAILECTEAEMLPPTLRDQLRSSEGKAELLARFDSMRLRVGD